MGAYSKTGKKLQIERAIHPGEVLKDELESRNIKQKDFAQTISMSPTQLNELLAGKRSISPQVAILLEGVLGIPAKFWLYMQADYELEAVRLSQNLQEKAA